MNNFVTDNLQIKKVKKQTSDYANRDLSFKKNKVLLPLSQKSLENNLTDLHNSNNKSASKTK